MGGLVDRQRVTRALLVLAAACVLVVVALTAPPSSGTAQPPSGTRFDYQLGGARSVPASVGIVVRDRHDRPAPGRYNVCYVNGFQTQPDESAFWRKHPDLVLRRDGSPVVDSAWGEWLLDTGTLRKRAALGDIVGRWIAGCARWGYDAVELDNLDSYTRSHGLLTGADNKAFARLLVRTAHRAGLAAGQKNWSEWDGRVVGYDFAIAEECGRWHECGSYVAHYGSRVLDVEYRDADLRTACAGWAGRIAIVRRDLSLSPTGVRRWC